MITRLENQPPLFQEENRPVPLQPPFDCNNPINYHKCCTVFCDSLSPWYDAVQCMNRCSGAATPSQPSLDMCCVILKLDNPLQCAQITKVCGGNCPGECTVINNNGQPPYYMVIENVPCNQVDKFISTLISGTGFIKAEHITTKIGRCPPMGIVEPNPDEDIPTTPIYTPDVVKCPPPVVKCPEPIINVNCPPPKIEIKNIIEPKNIIIDADNLQLNIPPPIVNLTCPAPIIKNIINGKDIDEETEEEEKEVTCESLELTDEEKEICDERKPKNHLEWLVSKAGIVAINKFVDEWGVPTIELQGETTFEALKTFRKNIKSQMSSPAPISQNISG